MDEKVLLRVALGIGLIGLILLFFISINLDIKDYRPNIVNYEDGSTVTFKGTVKRVTQSDKVTFIDIEKKETVTVVVFDSVNFKEGSVVEVTGKTSEYKGKDEIIADKIVTK